MQQSIHDISLSRSPWRYPVLYWQHHPGRLLVAVFHSRTLFVSPSIGIPAVGAELREHTRSVSKDATQIQHRIRLLFGRYHTDLMIPVALSTAASNSSSGPVNTRRANTRGPTSIDTLASHHAMTISCTYTSEYGS